MQYAHVVTSGLFLCRARYSHFTLQLPDTCLGIFNAVSYSLHAMTYQVVMHEDGCLLGLEIQITAAHVASVAHCSL